MLSSSGGYGWAAAVLLTAGYRTLADALGGWDPLLVAGGVIIVLTLVAFYAGIAAFHQPEGSPEGPAASR